MSDGDLSSPDYEESCIGFGGGRPEVLGLAEPFAVTRGCIPAPVCRHGLDEAKERWRGRRTDSDGICGDAAHAARASDHNPGFRGMAHAFDLSHDPAHGLNTYELADKLRIRCRDGKETRVKYIISNHRIASPANKWEWRPYTGSNPHDHHMHVSVNDGTENSLVSWWDFLDGTTTPPQTWGKYLHPMVGAFWIKEPSVKIGMCIVGADGGVFTLGEAQFHGSTGGTPLNKPVVGGAPHPSGNGYWLVAEDGGIFAFGASRFFGSTGSVRLNKPVVGMAATPSGNGYILVAADGGVFCYGDAEFHGSTAQVPLNKPVCGINITKSGHGYWLVAEDGGVFAFGDATYSNSAMSRVTARVVGMAVTDSELGYWILCEDGKIINCGDAGDWQLSATNKYKATELLSDSRGLLVIYEDGSVYSSGPGPVSFWGSVA